MAGLAPDDVFNAENFLDDLQPMKVYMISDVLNMDLSRLQGLH